MGLLQSIPSLVAEDPVLAGAVGSDAPAAVLSVSEPARAAVIAGIAHRSRRRPLVVALPTTTEADRLAHDLAAFLGEDAVDTFPAWETLPFERVSPSVETMGRRVRAMWRLREPSRAPRVLVASVRALVQRLGPHVEEAEPLLVRPGDRLDPLELVERLVGSGYRREYQVEHRGEVAVRGSIVDVFPSTHDVPVRIDLWGDEVDRLTEFSVHDQRATAPLEVVELFGCRELLPTAEVCERAERLVGTEPWGAEQWDRISQGLVFEGMESWLPWLTEGEHVVLDLVGPDALVLLCDPRRMRDRAADLLEEEASLASSLAQTWGAAGKRTWPQLHLPFDRLLAHTAAPAWTITSVPESPNTPTVQASGWDPVLGDGQRLTAQVSALIADGFRVVVAAEGVGSAGRVAALLRDQGLDLALVEDGDGGSGAPAAVTAPGGRVVVAPLERGFVLSAAAVKLAVLAESDVTGRRRPHRRPRARRADAERFFENLNQGDHVVHHQHGVGRYAGMVTRPVPGGDPGASRDYLLLEYRGGDKLYVPSDQVDAIRPYTGGETPTLNRLGGSDWQRTKSRVRVAAREVAEELVALYRNRVASAGHAFAPDGPWQHEMEDAFAFVETPDQRRAIAEVKSDMEEPVPMDRLICGDVGFGKTEVAIRAAFKAVLDGRQVAVLVPTTLLAQQHAQTFSDRFAGYPVRVEVLSRFLTPAQARAVVDGVASGEVDLVIGTHRLLSSDVTFKQLGLLVVDEEQRFGVTHKEAIKRLKTDVDVLTLTATPIPRTLEMSLTGIRDLTLLNTAPAERQPILTYVGEYDERAVGEALRRELLREGQVFFVHNRVQDIEHVAARLADLVPEARIAVAHGQMDESLLERVVLDFWEGTYDVLVCTTIIESGIDMPTVNTLVVDRADLMGLGQLHQLRGRVGRAGQRAYAYLFFPPERALSEAAYERLRTIGEHTELGSGFRIAMRDLEIRGAGNLLGADQSGHIAAVGYDLYVQMVSEAVAELKGEPVRPPAEIKLDLPLDAHLPSDYVAQEELRIEAYRRLAVVSSAEEVADVRQEWLDRFGPIPAPAEALLSVARLRAECVRTGIREITVVARSGATVARLSPLTLKTSQQMRLARLARGARWKEDLAQLVVPLPGAPGAADRLLDLITGLYPPEADGGADAPGRQAGQGNRRIASAAP
ncbi:MAG: transcription-repair coupling factor [Acidimicrobiales bacterium]